MEISKKAPDNVASKMAKIKTVVTKNRMNESSIHSLAIPLVKNFI